MAIPENIEQLANDVRTKIYGREVREALASGIEAAGSIANDADVRSQETETKQTSLEKKYDEQIANMSLENPSVAEVVDARVSGYDGQNFDTIGKRMDKVDAQLAQNEQQTKLQSFLFKTKTGLIAHRGSHLRAPENTIKAIYEAGRLGYEMVELDVQRTSDGVYMLMHDSTIDRTTNGTGTFRDMTYSQVKNLVVDEGYLGKSGEEVIRVPTFEEACQECQKWGLGINVDCSKMTWTEEVIIDVVEMLKRYNLFEKSFFVMGDRDARLTLAQIYPEVNVTWLTSDTNPANNIDECKNYKNAFVTYSQTVITDSLIRQYKNENIPVFVHSANTIQDVYKFVDKGVRFVETDLILPGGVF